MFVACILFSSFNRHSSHVECRSVVRTLTKFGSLMESGSTDETSPPHFWAAVELFADFTCHVFAIESAVAFI